MNIYVFVCRRRENMCICSTQSGGLQQGVPIRGASCSLKAMTKYMIYKHLHEETNMIAVMSTTRV